MTKKFQADDPRLTAYALGELDETEATDVKRHVDQSPELQKTVDEIRKTSLLLSEALLSEPKPALDEAQRTCIEQAAVASVPAQAKRPRRRELLRTLAAIGAASVLIMVVYVFVPHERGQLAQSTGGFADVESGRGLDLSFSTSLESGRPNGQFAAREQSGQRLVAASGKRNSAGSENKGEPEWVETGHGGRMKDYTNTLSLILPQENSSPETGAEVSGQSAMVLDRKLLGKNDAGATRSKERLEGTQVFQPQISLLTSHSGRPPATPGPAASGVKTRDVSDGTSNTISVGETADVDFNVQDTVGGPKTDNHGNLLQPFGAADTRNSPNSLPAKPQQQSRSGASPDSYSETESLARAAIDIAPGTIPPADGGLAGPVTAQRLDDLATMILRGNEAEVAHAMEVLAELEKGKLAEPDVIFNDRGSDLQSKPKLQEKLAELVRRRHVASFEGDNNEQLIAEVRRLIDARRRSRLRENPDIPDSNTESYAPIVENKFLSPWDQPLSTFSIDVDTGSYANVRRFLNQGHLPPRDAVRIEEMVNYFHYDDPAPVDGKPFAVNVEVGDCPWADGHRLVRVGIKGKEIHRSERPASNLVFLIDVSGSMQDANKLPLVKSALRMLVERMTENDRVAIVTYASDAGVLLQPTLGSDRATIMTAIGGLSAGGSTNGEAGIKLAYDMARANFNQDGANRVILCTDGDFNVGQSDDSSMVALIRREAMSGVFLSVFGFGMGNLKDAKLEQIADKGNGNYGYVDSLKEAEKVFVEEMTGTLYTIAKDVKLQIEFNPGQVGAYRLIGYDNRIMPPQDFHNDAKDAGDIGAGHSVTALYEIVPPDKVRNLAVGGGLKYQRPAEQPNPNVVEPSNDLLTLQLRYKEPKESQSKLLEIPVMDRRDEDKRPSRDFQWSAGVSAFGMVLRNSEYKGAANLDLVLQLAAPAVGEDAAGHRKEFLDLVYATRGIQMRK